MSLDNPISQSTFTNHLGLYSPDGEVDIDRTASLLGVSRTELASALDLSPSQLRPDRAGAKTIKRIEELAHALELVAVTFEGDLAKTKFWIRTPNPNFGNLSPKSLILKGRHKQVIEFIRSASHAN